VRDADDEGHSHPALERYLGKDGLIARALPGFERRVGQERMMRAVMTALDERRVLLVEAGTGTGKSLAYLLPAVVSGLRVIIATGTRTLQDQLWEKQIPFVREVLGIPFSAAVLKGRTNYLCLLLLEQAKLVPDLALDKREELGRIVTWASETETGDRGELFDLTDRSLVWRAVAADQDQCLNRRCPHYDGCFLMSARRKAAMADIIIVNHHLFFADLALGADRDVGLLPTADAVIFDEAHHIEDVAAQAFGVQISDARHLRFVADLRRALLRTEGAGRDAERTMAAFTSETKDFWSKIRQLTMGPEGYRPPMLDAEARDAYARLDNRLIELTLLAGTGAVDDEALRRLGERGEQLRADTFELVMHDDPDGPAAAVRWVDHGPRATFIRSAPVAVGPDLSRHLFHRFSRVVFTSATLTVGDDFSHVADRLGLEDPMALHVPSPFDYERQAILFLPADLPDPYHQDYLRCAAAHIESLVRVTKGRALILFTSYQKMREARGLLADAWLWPTLMQGDGSKEALLQHFRDTPNAVLFATQTFWEGVDVPGDALSLVVIDKLPFQSPGNPLVDARIGALKRAGRNPFMEFQVPRAIFSLKQGLGRLIRHRDDRGIVAILDPRVLRARYGRVLLDALPPFARTSDFEVVEEFWRSINRD